MYNTYEYDECVSNTFLHCYYIFLFKEESTTYFCWGGGRGIIQKYFVEQIIKTRAGNTGASWFLWTVYSTKSLE